jgi:hypothetical protein
LFASTLTSLRADAPVVHFTYDEADYVHAAFKGWAEDCLDALIITLD